LMLVDVDVRLNFTSLQQDYEQAVDVHKFRGVDKDGSGELDREEFGQLARQLLPKITDETLDLIFKQTDTDGSGLLSFNEYLISCVPRLRAEEAKAEQRELQENKEARAREIRQVMDHMTAQAERRLKRELVKQAEEFYTEFKEKVKAESSLQRKAMAELAAEMMLHHCADRASPSATRSRKLVKLSRAIESAALPEDSVIARSAGELTAVEEMRALSTSPRLAKSKSGTPRKKSKSPRVMTSRLELQDFMETPKYR
jgi:Ca2+-binding EF-hand superfamily protein